jgi:cytochrome c oxidase cbb3-type subunit 1
MWHAINPDGSLHYSFMETLAAMVPYWWVRAFSGVLYLAGVLVFVYNLVQTVKQGEAVAEPA